MRPESRYDAPPAPENRWRDRRHKPSFASPDPPIPFGAAPASEGIACLVPARQRLGICGISPEPRRLTPAAMAGKHGRRPLRILGHDHEFPMATGFS